MRRPRGRVYGEGCDDDNGAEETELEDGQLEAIGQGAGESGGWRGEGRGWCGRCDRIQGGIEETGDATGVREYEGPAIGDMARAGPEGLLDASSGWTEPVFFSSYTTSCMWAKRWGCAGIGLDDEGDGGTCSAAMSRRAGLRREGCPGREGGECKSIADWRPVQ